MTWLLLAAAAYLLLAVAATIDKLMMSGRVSHPAVYAFFVSAFNIIALVLAPFGMTLLPSYWLGISLLSGAALTAAIFFLFSSVFENDSTRVMPFTGGATPLFTVILAYIFLGERFSPFEWLAFGILVFAAVLVSANFFGGKKGRLVHAHNLFLASLFFALSYFLSKFAFDAQPFLSVFIWSRLGSFGAGLMLLLVPIFRTAILKTFHTHRNKKQKIPFVFFAGQAAGALGVFLINYAINLGSVSLVNALQGLQSVFLLSIIWLLEFREPNLLSEHFSRREFLQRAVSVALIFVGLGILAYGQ